MGVVAVGSEKARRSQVMKRWRGDVLPDANVVIVAALDHRDTQAFSRQGARRDKPRWPSSENENRRFGTTRRH